MGVATDGLLVYGYDLGGDEEWKVREVDRWGGLTLDWFPGPDNDEDEDEPPDFVGKAGERLLQSPGLTAADVGALGYFEEQRVMAERCGVGIETYCCNDCSSYVLTTRSVTVNRGDVEAVDLTALAAMPTEHGWNDRLASALRLLGLTPVQAEPGWLLVSWKG